MKIELARCAFCGEKAEADLYRGFAHWKTGRQENAVAIYCTGCPAEMALCHSDFPGQTPEALFEILARKWNRRIPTEEDER
jgi:hypothetical protein